MKILFIASEASPLVKVGGLADVIGSLSKALTTLGHEVRLILPKYGSLKADMQGITGGTCSLKVSFMGRSEPATLKTTRLRENVSVYLVENQNYFGTDEVYTDNDLERFLFFSLAVPGILSKLDWRPDIIHCHDWHTALVPLWLKEAGSFFPTVFTIHNLAYQGPFDHRFSAASGLGEVWHRHTPSDAPAPPLNFMSQGILLADIITTVSPTYATEILTPEYGEGLDHLLRYRRQSLFGITNGIDYEEYNPADDPYLAVTYDSATLEQRTINKIALQKKANLPQSPDMPLIGMVTRLDEQKGLDLLVPAMDSLLSETKAQFVILGRGREHYQDLLRQAVATHPDRLALFIAFNEEVAHLVYGSSDMFLMPSRFEPCGLGQLIALRYGSIPVVRRTGGLADTVEDVDTNLERGNGFVFQSYDSASLIKAVKRAEEAFCDKAAWQKLMKRNMTLDLSWEISARKYEDVYNQAMGLSRSARNDN
jgi:starch synthase